MPIEQIENSSTVQYAMSFYHENGTSFDVCPGINIFDEALADVAYQEFLDYLLAWPKLSLGSPPNVVKTTGQGYEITPTPAPPE